ncbi:MAG: HAD family phosphatase [Clostridia bacterium]|nr:HAD family phosphatase [Clostridia bacterium]
MRKTNYKMIVSDFDGTLVQGDGKVSEKNIKAINEYIDAGGIFVISTGRVPSAILSRARELGLKGLVSCCQGTIILDIESGNMLFDQRLPEKTTVDACREMEKLGLHIHAYDLWEYYSNIDDEMLKHYENITETKAKLVLDEKLSDFIVKKKLSAYKLLAMVLPEDNAIIVAKLKEANIPDCDITKSAKFLVEIVNDKCSKGSAVSFLAKHYGIEIEKTVGIGDNYNDISMIEAVGLGVAVANAEDALKQKADYVCENSNEQSAIAEVIEKFGFC